MSNRIYQIRKKRKLSQEEMAHDLGVSSNYISLIENGKKEPGLSFLKKVAREYNFPFILLAQDKILPAATNSTEREIREKLTSLMTEIENNLIFE